MTGITAGTSVSAYHFGDYVFDVKRRELIFGVDKDLLLDIGWLGRPISPNSLNVAIANIRRHFASSPPTLDIRSTPKKGYALHLNCKVKTYYGKLAPIEVIPQFDLVAENEPPVLTPTEAMPSLQPVNDVTGEICSVTSRSIGQRLKLVLLSCIARPLLAKGLIYINLALINLALGAVVFM